MNLLPFVLRPFPGGPEPLCRISGTVSRQGARLCLTYTLAGDVARVAWPPSADEPARRDDLWQETCCECFLARPGEAGYWEANFSPAGHWQLYRFDGYREGRRPEAAVTTIAIAAEPEAEVRRLTATLDLSPLLLPQEPLQLGVTMVVRAIDGATGYWALAHPGSQPDFHLRAGFTLAP